MKKTLLILAYAILIPVTAGTSINCQEDYYGDTIPAPAPELRSVEEYKEVIGEDADYKLIKEAIKGANNDCQKALDTCPQ